MIRIASVFPPVTPTLVRPSPTAAVPRAPVLPPVTPTPVTSRLSPDANAAQSEAAFAIAAGRNAPPPIQPGELSLPTDPLPDLPALGVAVPDPEIIAAKIAKQNAQAEEPVLAAGSPTSPPTGQTVVLPLVPAQDVPSQAGMPQPQHASAPASLAVARR